MKQMNEYDKRETDSQRQENTLVVSSGDGLEGGAR